MIIRWSSSKSTYVKLVLCLSDVFSQTIWPTWQRLLHYPIVMMYWLGLLEYLTGNLKNVLVRLLVWVLVIITHVLLLILMSMNATWKHYLLVDNALSYISVLLFRTLTQITSFEMTVDFLLHDVVTGTRELRVLISIQFSCLVPATGWSFWSHCNNYLSWGYLAYWLCAYYTTCYIYTLYNF